MCLCWCVRCVMIWKKKNQEEKTKEMEMYLIFLSGFDPKFDDCAAEADKFNLRRVSAGNYVKIFEVLVEFVALN